LFAFGECDLTFYAGQNGNVSKLISDGFIYRASQVSYGGMRGSFTFPVNITDWTWDFILENPEVLDEGNA